MHYSESLSVPPRSEYFSEGIQRSASPTPLRKDYAKECYGSQFQPIQPIFFLFFYSQFKPHFTKPRYYTE